MANPELKSSSFEGYSRLGTERESHYKTILQRAVGAEYDIRFANLEDFDQERWRFLYAFTKNPDNEKAGFIKVARISESTGPDSQNQLRRESAAMAALEQLGIETVKQLHPYQELPEGYALVHFEALDEEYGQVPSNKDMIYAAPKEHGEWAAEIIYKTTSKPIPPEMDTEVFRKKDSTTATFLKHWKNSRARVFELEHFDFIPAENLKRIQPRVDSILAELVPLIDEDKRDNEKFFVHADSSPSNMFFNRDSKSAILLDFEWASVTDNPTLGKVKDYGNFYGRTWPNPEMQKAFLQRMLEKSSDEDLDRNYKLLKGAAAYGAVELAHHGVKPDHPEHDMAKAQLNNLESNLDFLEQIYESRKEKNAS